MTCVVAWAALGDRLAPVQLAGCAAVVTAVVILNPPRKLRLLLCGAIEQRS